MSSKVYCIAEFAPKVGKEQQLFETLRALEPLTQREDGCIRYTITRQIQSPFAEGSGLPIVFNECWQNMQAFESHCQQDYIVDFFQTCCLSEDGLAAEWNVRVFSDE
jgi:quinol monooxygenase YgiN